MIVLQSQISMVNMFDVISLIIFGIKTGSSALLVEQTHLAPKSHCSCPIQCDQIKIAKCLLKLPKNGFTRKTNDFDTFTKIA